MGSQVSSGGAGPRWGVLSRMNSNNGLVAFLTSTSLCHSKVCIQRHHLEQGLSVQGCGVGASVGSAECEFSEGGDSRGCCEPQ